MNSILKAMEPTQIPFEECVYLAQFQMPMSTHLFNRRRAKRSAPWGCTVNKTHFLLSGVTQSIQEELFSNNTCLSGLLCARHWINQGSAIVFYLEYFQVTHEISDLRLKVSDFESHCCKLKSLSCPIVPPVCLGKLGILVSKPTTIHKLVHEPFTKDFSNFLLSRSRG